MCVDNHQGLSFLFTWEIYHQVNFLAIAKWDRIREHLYFYIMNICQSRQASYRVVHSVMNIVLIYYLVSVNFGSWTLIQFVLKHAYK